MYNYVYQHTALDGVLGSLLLIRVAVVDDILTPQIFWFGFLSGVFGGVATICINYAMAHGVAGPANAVTNMGSITQTILDVLFLGQVLNVM